MNPSQQFAAELVANLVALGVKDFYLAPGARSQALAIAVSQMVDANKASLTIRLDERSLAFAALGRSLATGKPVAVITTSGTAVANLHPAVLEAQHAGVPLLLLTADRPARLRGLGANQTTNQEGIFGDIPCFDIASPKPEFQPDGAQIAMAALDLMLGGTRPSPVQLNLQFEEPLSSSSPNAAQLSPLAVASNYANSVQSVELEIDDSTVVVAGAGAGVAATEFAQAANLPLFAEPSSGSRFGDQVVVNYPELLKTDLADRIKTVVVFGKPSLSRSVMKLIKTSRVYVVRSNYEPFNVFENARMIVDSIVPIGRASDHWIKSFSSETTEDPRAGFVSKVWDSIKDEALLFGASDLIRVAENCLPPKPLRVFSNRGLAGIDGTVSTALGIAQAGNKVKALLGDLTLIHEISGLNLSGLGDLDVQLIIGNDNGGHIFDHLEMREHLSPEWFEKLFTTPQQLDLEPIVTGFGWKYIRCENLTDLDEAIRTRGFVVIDYQLNA